MCVDGKRERNSFYIQYYTLLFVKLVIRSIQMKRRKKFGYCYLGQIMTHTLCLYYYFKVLLHYLDNHNKFEHTQVLGYVLDMPEFWFRLPIQKLSLQSRVAENYFLWFVNCWQGLTLRKAFCFHKQVPRRRTRRVLTVFQCVCWFAFILN
jgi:hypothetical protein